MFSPLDYFHLYAMVAVYSFLYFLKKNETFLKQNNISGVGVNKTGEGGQKIQTFSYKISKSRAIRYSTVTVINKTVLDIWKPLKEQVLNFPPPGSRSWQPCGDGCSLGLLWRSFHSEQVKPVCFAPETNEVTCQLHLTPYLATTGFLVSLLRRNSTRQLSPLPPNASCSADSSNWSHPWPPRRQIPMTALRLYFPWNAGSI